MLRSLLLPVVLGSASCIAVSPGAAVAQSDQPRLLVDMLTEWAEAEGVTLVVPGDLVEGLTIAPGEETRTRAPSLDSLLQPFGLTYETTGQGAVVIRRAENTITEAGRDLPPVARETLRLQLPVKPMLADFGDLTLGRVIVTTQLRPQPLADVPISVTAVSGARIEREDLTDLERVSERAPGFFAQRQTDASPSFVIRGIEATTGGAAAEPSVSIFVDGFDASRWRGSNVELLDIDRIEIVRGPQGTLFGRGAQIGAVAIHTNRANLLDRELRLEAETGSDDLLSLTGVLNQPVLDGEGALRLAIRRREQAGFRSNLLTPDRDVNDDDLLALRVAGAWQAHPHLRFDLVYNHQNDRDRAVSTKAIGLASPGGDDDPTSDAVQNPESAPQRRRLDRVQLFAEWVLSDVITLSAMTGHRQVDLKNTFDPDGTSYAFLFSDVDFRQSAIQHELQLRVDGGGRWRATIGVSGFLDDSAERNDITINEQLLEADFPNSLVPVDSKLVDGVETPLSSGVISMLETHNQRQSYSVYANASLDITRDLTLDAGLRVTRDETELVVRRTVDTLDGVAPALLPNGLLGTTYGQPVRQSRSETLLAPRLALTYALTDDLNLYASYSEGSRAGYPQPGISNPSTGQVTVERGDIEDETVRNLEAGLKGALNDKVTVDIATFVFRQEDFQTFRPPPSLEATNGGQATGRGVEAATSIALAEGLDVFASYAWLDAHYDTYRVEGEDGGLVDLGGNRFRLAPEHTVNAALSWVFPVGGTWEGFASANYAWRSGYFFNNDNLPDEQQEAFGLLDARIGLSSADGRWRLELYGDNLLDERWIRDIGNTGKYFGVSTAIPADPRIIGIRIALDLS